jgi:hypothetical protein
VGTEEWGELGYYMGRKDVSSSSNDSKQLNVYCGCLFYLFIY